MAEITQNSILRINDQKTMLLIELYEKEECLWNTYLDDYKNRELRARAAERIAKALDVKNFEAKHVLIKFKNLRNSYCQELKKIAQSVSLGLGEDGVYRPKVFWFSKMDSFLRPHLQPPRGGQSNVVRDDRYIKIEPEISQEETEEWVQMTSPEEVLLSDAHDQEHSWSDNEDLAARTDKDVRVAQKRKRKSSGTSSRKQLNDGEPLWHTLRDISGHLLTLPLASQQEKVDYFDSFGLYIAAMLRSMSPQRALSLQPQIVNLITSAMLGTEDVRVSQSDESG